MDFQNRAVDVICQHTKKGKLIPIKLCLQDDEREFQAYVVKAYKDLSYKGSYIMPNGITVTSTIFSFDCKIIVFGREWVLQLYYNSNDRIWRMA